MASKTALQRATRVFTTITQGRGFHRVLRKVQITSFGDGKCSCSFVVTEEHENKQGTMHGGFTATLVDTITTMALLSSGRAAPGVSVDLSVSYLRPAKRGDEVIVDAECLKIGKKLAFTTADIKDKNGKLLAQGKHTKYIEDITSIQLKNDWSSIH